MKILILGGTRYFGRRLTHLLLAEGHQVSILSRGNTPDDFGSRVSRLQADRNQAGEVKKALGSLKFDVVVDQVCMTEQNARDAVDLFSGKTDYYVMTSTMSVYPWGPDLKEEIVNPHEYKKINPTNPMETYADGKRAAESIFSASSSFKTSFARFPIVLGDDDYTRRLHFHVEKILKQEPLYFPNRKAQMGFIRSEDAARSLLWLVHNRPEGAFNFASEDVMSLNKLIEMIEKAARQKAKLISEDVESARSPFGIPEDWFMNVQKAKSQGYLAQPLSDWLQPLIERISKSF